MHCVVTLALAALATPVSAASPDDISRQDQRLLDLSDRMLIASANRCEETMPNIGLIMHSRDQYAASSEEYRERAFPPERPLAVLAVGDPSPSRSAGIAPGAWLTGIGSWRTETSSSDERQLRLRAFDALASLPAEEYVVLHMASSAGLSDVAIPARPACRILVEQVPGSRRFARSDGSIIQISSKLLEEVDDSQLAVILAHELAHAVLQHRERLDEADVKKGLLGEFGKSARLAREAEIEADRLSVHLLADAGLDPSAGPQFWRSSVGKSISGGLLRSRIYPSAKGRAELMEAEIASAGR
ncbi:M48 family metalloprotease [Altererythrobacter sp. CAU 1778]